MAHHAHVEGLTAVQAAELAEQWRQLGAVNIRRSDQADGLFTMDADFPDSPFAAEAPAPPAPAPAPGRPAAPRKRRPR